MRRFISALILLLLPAAAWAQQPRFGNPPKPGDDSTLGGPMTFAPISDGMMFVYGSISEGDSQRLRAALDAVHPKVLLLQSGGGDLGEGIEMGRIIRKYKITTRVANGYQCISACNFVFLGGLFRYVDTGATFKVHMFARPDITGLREVMAEPPTSLLEFSKLFPDADVWTPAIFKKLTLIVSAQLMLNGKEKEKETLEALQADFGGDFVEAVYEFENYTKQGQCLIPLATQFVKEMQQQKQQQQQAVPQQVQQPQPQQPPKAPAADALRHYHVSDQAQGQNSFGKPVETLFPGLKGPEQAPQQQPPPQQPQQQPPAQQEQQPQQQQKKPQIVDFPDDACLQGALLYYLDVWTTAEIIKLMQKNAAATAAELATFLTQMSVSLRYLTEFSTIPNDKPRPLTREELHMFNIVNVD